MIYPIYTTLHTGKNKYNNSFNKTRWCSTKNCINILKADLFYSGRNVYTFVNKVFCRLLKKKNCLYTDFTPPDYYIKLICKYFCSSDEKYI